MLKKQDRIFTNFQGVSDGKLEAALKRGDWDHTKKYLEKGAVWIKDELVQAALRERKGNGREVVKKWQEAKKTTYLVISADEREPGTCRGKYLLQKEPHKIIEGALLASAATGASVGYIYLQAEYHQEFLILQEAIEDAYAKGFLGKNACKSDYDFHLYIHRGPGAHLGSDETAILESIEGKRGVPRLNSPLLEDKGLFGTGAIVHDVETIAIIPTILRRGSAWFSSLGKASCTGTKIFCLSGHIHTPCIVEESMGIPLRELIEKHGGGVQGGWKNLQSIIPGGAGVALLPKEVCETVMMDFESLALEGSGLGTGGLIVMDQSVDIVKAMARLSKFYKEENCGECTPCREGTPWIWQILERMRVGNACSEEIDHLQRMAKHMACNSLCAFGGAAASPVQGLIHHFREEIEDRIKRYHGTVKGHNVASIAG